jgi:hypothetical protein
VVMARQAFITAVMRGMYMLPMAGFYGDVRTERRYLWTVIEV